MRLLPLTVLLLLLAGCQSGSSDAVSADEVAAAPEPIATGATVPVARTAAQRPPAAVTPRLIKTARLSLRVDDYADAITALRDTVAAYDAYLAGEQEERRTYRIQNTITLRVAAAEFDALLDALTGLAASVESRTVDVQDVTEEYVDVEARLRSRRAAEQQYLDILQQARSVEDVLAVQRQLDQVREEIERAEGRMRYLQDRIGYSTITATLYQATEYSLAEGPGFFTQVGDALVSGWRGLLDAVLALISVWPFLLFVGLVVGLGLRWRRRRRPVPAQA